MQDLPLVLLLLFVFMLVGCVHSSTTLRGALALDSDPKTVNFKHHQDDQSHGNLKFLFFGTSRTYGKTLRNERLAYPYLLSPNATNLAIDAGTIMYPNNCLVSMLKKDNDGTAFDVIGLEAIADGPFFPYTLNLARRLRQRFPHALIIFLDMWRPNQYRHIATRMPIGRWAQDQDGYTGNIDVPSLVKKLTKPDEWEYPPHAIYTEEQVQQMLAIGGSAVLRTIGERPVNAHAAIMDTGFFHQDLNHPSEAGHQFVAHQIIDLLKQSNFRTNHVDIVHPYDTIDQCESWFKSGVVASVEYDPKNLRMNEFKPGKFALEMVNGQQDAWIKVMNQNKQPSQLTIEYMTTSPDCLYPTMQISIEGGESVEVRCQQLSYPHDVHVLEQIHVGALPPGPSMIRFHGALGTSKWPFRLAGILIMNDDCKDKSVNDRLRCNQFGFEIF